MPQHIQHALLLLAVNDVDEPTLKKSIPKCLPIDNTSTFLSALNSLKNNSSNNIAIDLNEPFDGICAMIFEPIGCSWNLKEMFGDIIEDSNLLVTSNINVSLLLKRMVDDAYWMADVGIFMSKEAGGDAK